MSNPINPADYMPKINRDPARPSQQGGEKLGQRVPAILPKREPLQHPTHTAWGTK